MKHNMHLNRILKYQNLLAILIFLALAFITLRKFILNEGIVTYRDLTWPFNLKLLFDDLFYTFNLDWTRRVIYLGPIISAALNFDIEPALVQKLLFLFIRTLTGFSAYFIVYNLFFRDKSSNRLSSFILSIIAGFLYLYNPIATTMIAPTLAFSFSYSLLPFVFYFYEQALHKNKFKYYFLTSIFIVLTIAGTIQFFVLILIFLIFWFLLNVLFEAVNRNFKKLFRMIKASFFTLIIFGVISLYWIFPSLMIVLGGVVLQPGYVLTAEMLNVFSRPGLLSVFRLMGDWWPRILLTPIQFIPNWLWINLTFTIPIVALLSVIIYKNDKRYGRYVIFLVATSLFIIFLNKGNQEPISWFYQMLYKMPIVGWMFRVPSKWAMLLALPYTLLATLTIHRFLGWSKNLKNGLFATGKVIITILIIVFILTSTALVSWPMFTGDFGGVFEPEKVPEEYLQLYDWLEEQNSDFRILMYPSPPAWGVAKPTVPHDLYRQFTESKLLANRTNNFGKLYAVWNVKYVIMRGDALENEEESLIRSMLVDQNDLSLVKIFDSLLVFENENYINHLNIPVQRIVSTGLKDVVSLNNIENFISVNSSLFFLDQMTLKNKYNYVSASNALIIDGNSLDLSLSFLEDGHIVDLFDTTNHHYPSKIWSKAATNDPLHGPWHSYLEKRNIENWDFDYGKGLVFTWAPSILDKTSPIKKEDILTTYDFEDSITSWGINVPNLQKMFLTNMSHHGESSLAVELNASEWGWKTVISPLIPINYESQYKWEFYVKGKDAYKVHAKVTECKETKEIINAYHMSSIGSGDFDWEKVSFNFIPSSSDTKYMQLQIWHGHETNLTLPNKIWIDDVKVYDLSDYLKPNSLDIPFKVEKDGSYELFIRYFKNQDGGKIGLHLDGDLLDIIETEDQLNKFIWDHLKTLDLKHGSHTLTLENIGGFNAVNIFALIPSNEYENLENEIYDLIKNKRIIYLFEVEYDLYRENAEVLNVGGEASNGEITSLQPDSKLWRDIDILRDGNYTIALRLNGSAFIKIDNQPFTVNSTRLNFVYLSLHLEQGGHKIEILPEQYQPITWNFDESENDFEEWKENTPESLIYSLSLDKENEKSCLKAELFNATWGWKLINSPLIPINSSKEEYLLKFNIKGENAHAVHAKIVEYNQSEKLIQATRLGSIGDGTFDWKNVSFKFNPSSENTSFLQLQIWHGHNTSKPLPNILWLDNVKIYGYVPPQVDVLWIYPTKENETIDDLFAPQESPAKIITYEKINPTKYILTINATAPFMLSFAESYDPLWAAYTGSIEYQPIPLYSVINGFWINKTGNLEIIIRYKPQDWFETGSLISIIALIGCTGYLFYDWKKNDERIKMIKRKMYTILKKKK